MEVKCPYFNLCGGCNKLDIPYEEEIKEKEVYIQKLFQSVGYKKPIEVVKADNPYYYRNKVMMAFKLSKTKKVVSGIYEEYSHKIVTVDDCLIQSETINKILKSVNIALSKNKIKPYINGGVVKHVLVRHAFKTNQIMVVIVTPNELFPGRANFVKDLLKLEPSITTIVQNIQSRDTSIVLGTKERVLYGKGFIIDELCGLKFKLSPRSFFQINPPQTEKLYNIAMEFANLRVGNTVIDAYSGIGTIGMVASKTCGKVICVENNPDAVTDAKFNAKLNNINNINFYLEDSTKFINELAQNRIKVDCVILDPPRTGTTYNFISAISKMGIKRVVYVSCGPETLVRDLKIFKDFGYNISNVKCADMFPRTEHVETVVLLSHKSSEKHINVKVDFETQEGKKFLDEVIDAVDSRKEPERASYPEIKEYILNKYNVKVSTLNIAQTKAKYGIIERECYNKPKDENSRQPKCTKEKEEMIVDALKHFKMI